MRSTPRFRAAIRQENTRQEQHIELIASENYASPAVMAAQGTQLTNKYAEGYPGKRYYGGCEYVDIAETLALTRLKELFGLPTIEIAANVQPHSGAQANEAVFLALLSPGDTIMGMSLAEGGHLTHGMPLNISGKWFKVVSYGLNEAEEIDYDAMESLAHQHRPKLIIAGASAYSLRIDFARFARVTRDIDAHLMVDMAHYAGLIAAGVYPSPVPHADVITSTTHKTLRGPRGGLILMKPHLEKAINSAVFPGLQGGPLMHVIASKAVAFKEALQPDFKAYQQQVLANARHDGRGAGPARPANRLRPHREPPDAGRLARQEDHRQGGRGSPRPGAHHDQQERDSQGSGKADGHQRNPVGIAGDDHTGLQGGGIRAGREPDRRRSRCSTRRCCPDPRPERGRRADRAFPGLRCMSSSCADVSGARPMNLPAPSSLTSGRAPGRPKPGPLIKLERVHVRPAGPRTRGRPL